MAKINIVIADYDSEHINRLVNYIVGQNKQLEISCFSERGSLLRYVADPSTKIHILLFAEEMYSEEIERKKIDLKMILSEGGFEKHDKYKCVNKYQRADDFLNEVLMEYADSTGRIDIVSSGDAGDTRAIALYSPVGGSGKTTIALALAKSLAQRQRSVIYLNYEGISSVSTVFKPMGIHTMSEVFLAAKTKKANVGLKVVQCKENDYDTGIDFIAPPESAMEYSEMTPGELRKIISEVKALKQYNDIIIDMNSGYNDDIFEVLAECNVILMPFTSTESSKNKMTMLADEINKNEKLEQVSKRIVAIENLSRGITQEAFGEIQIATSVPESPVLRNTNNILYSDTDDTIRNIISMMM